VRWRGAAAFAALLALVVAGGCGPAFHDSIPAPPSTRPSASTTTIADLSGVSLGGVAGSTTIGVAMGPGGATLNGNVVGPTGPIPGATVHVDRVVGDSSASTEVQTAADGTWTVAHVLGGRFRVRAWRAPDLALTTPQIIYMGATETRALTLQLDQYQGVSVTPSVAPDPPVIAQPANLAVVVANATVDAKGVVRFQPIPAVQVQLSGAGQWAIGGTNPATTAADGTASWPVECTVPGAATLTAVINATQSVALTVSACSLPPTTTTAPPTTVTGPTTTSLRPTTTVH
jgi:hypothetical protein